MAYADVLAGLSMQVLQREKGTGNHTNTGKRIAYKRDKRTFFRGKMQKSVKRRNKPGAGRPRKALPENWKELILQYSAEGCSAVEIRANLCMLTGTFDHTTWDALIEREQEFSTTVKKASVLCQAWWERQARYHLGHNKNDVFETALWFINMKNRFGWVDKHEIDHGMTDELLEKYKEMSNHDLIESTKILAREVLTLEGTSTLTEQKALPEPA